MPLEPADCPPLMCLTQDGLALSHREQAERLCAAGARWIQLRMKSAEPAEWLATAQQVVAICHRHDAICVINDSVDVALASGADGVHLNWRDEDWTRARHRLGPRPILGGTVNDASDASRAAAAGVLDYVGIGPWRFTPTKRKLAPVLGPERIAELVRRLEFLPAWAVGGIVAADLPAVRATGARGAAISAALFRAGEVEANYRVLDAAWRASANDRQAGLPGAECSGPGGAADKGSRCPANPAASNENRFS